jgi:multidrug efflux pump
MTHREFKLSSLAVDGRTTIFILTVLLVLFGVMQYQATPKEEMPEIVFPYYMIGSIYPGTSPADVENLITRPLEKRLKGINGVKEISSNSIQDYSSIFIEFDLGADETQAYLDVKQAVDDARSELPTDLFQEPQIRRIDLSEIPILYINLTGDLGLVRLKQLAEDLQDRIESLEEITRVDIAGALDREIQIDVDLYRMQAAGLSFNAIRGAIAAENLTMSGGQVASDGMRRNLRVVGEFGSVDQIREIVLQEGIALRDIAEVRRRNPGPGELLPPERGRRRDPQRDQAGRRNLIAAVDKIKAELADFERAAPGNLSVTLSGDSSQKTRNGVSDLFNTIILGFLVVVFVLMFFMGRTNAVFVGIAIPLSMLVAFIFLPVIGFTLNKVVLMAFILVLGIVVDNSIVVVENIYRHFMTTEHLPIVPATKRAVGEVALAVFTGTLTTMAPFVPLIFTPGIAGKFMSYLPITIILALTASLFVAYIINPVFAVAFMKYAPREENAPAPRPSRRVLALTAIAIGLAAVLYAAGLMILANLLAFGVLGYYVTRFVLARLIDRFQCCVMPAFMAAYRRALAFVLRGRRPAVLVAAVVLLFFSSFFLMRLRPPRVVFFPGGEPNTLYVYITMPEGTHLDATDAVCREVERRISAIVGRDNPDVESIVSNVAVNAGSGMFERSTQDRLAKVTVNFVEYKDRRGPRSTGVVMEDLRRELRGIPGAEIRIDREAMGPPSGAPVNIEISGDDIAELLAISGRLEAFIGDMRIEGLEAFKSSMEVGKPEIILEIDREKANRLGVSTAQIGGPADRRLRGRDLQVPGGRGGVPDPAAAGPPLPGRSRRPARPDRLGAGPRERRQQGDPHLGRRPGVLSLQLRRHHPHRQQAGDHPVRQRVRRRQRQPDHPADPRRSGPLSARARIRRRLHGRAGHATRDRDLLRQGPGHRHVPDLHHPGRAVQLALQAGRHHRPDLPELHRRPPGLHGLRAGVFGHHDRHGDHRGGRDRGQERHHHHRLHGPAAGGRRRRPARLRGGGGGHAPDARPADGVVDHPGPDASGHRDELQLPDPVHPAGPADLLGRRQRRVLEPAGLDHHLRPDLHHGADAVRGPGHVHAVHPAAAPPGRRRGRAGVSRSRAVIFRRLYPDIPVGGSSWTELQRPSCTGSGKSLKSFFPDISVHGPSWSLRAVWPVASQGFRSLPVPRAPAPHRRKPRAIVLMRAYRIALCRPR